MIYVLTVHWKSDRWIKVQADYLRRHTTEDFRFHACVEGVDEAIWRGCYDRVIPAVGEHSGKLNLLAWDVLEAAAADDLLIFIDGDAFPTRPYIEEIRRLLQTRPLVAIRRDENAGDPQPHPSFCATTAGFWREIRGDWSRGASWPSADQQEQTDVGGNLLYTLEQRGFPWHPLLRTRGTKHHPVFFGVYGDIVYHHGSGFRKGLGRAMRVTSPWRRAKQGRRPDTLLGRYLESRWKKSVRNSLQIIGDEIYQEIVTDPNFHERLA